MNRLSVCLIAALTMCAGAGQAADYTVGNLQIANPWTRATPKGSTVAGGYMVITNKGTAPDRLAGRFGNHREPVRSSPHGHGQRCDDHASGGGRTGNQAG